MGKKNDMYDISAEEQMALLNGGAITDYDDEDDDDSDFDLGEFIATSLSNPESFVPADEEDIESDECKYRKNANVVSGSESGIDISITKYENELTSLLYISDRMRHYTIDMRTLGNDEESFPGVDVSLSTAEYLQIVEIAIMTNLYPSAVFTTSELLRYFNHVSKIDTSKFLFLSLDEDGDVNGAYYINEQVIETLVNLIDKLMAEKKILCFIDAIHNILGSEGASFRAAYAGYGDALRFTKIYTAAANEFVKTLLEDDGTEKEADSDSEETYDSLDITPAKTADALYRVLLRTDNDDEDDDENEELDEVDDMLTQMLLNAPADDYEDEEESDGLEDDDEVIDMNNFINTDNCGKDDKTSRFVPEDGNKFINAISENPANTEEEVEDLVGVTIPDDDEYEDVDDMEDDEEDLFFNVGDEDDEDNEEVEPSLDMPVDEYVVPRHI